MTVYKACMKILNKNKAKLIMYLCIFLAFAISFATNETNSVRDFENANIRVAVIDRDGGDIANKLTSYIGTEVELVNIIDSEEGIADALFYRIAEYVLVIPKGFSENMLNGEEPKLDKYEVVDSYSGIFMDNVINKYLTSASIQISETGKLDDDIESNETVVEVINQEAGENQGMLIYYNFAAYCIMATSILGVAALLSVFSDEKIKRKNMISPMSLPRFYVSQMLASLLLTVIIWSVIVIAGVITIGSKAVSGAGIYMMINSLIFSLVCLTLGFLISTVVKSENGQNAIANIISLGFSFISGVFVPLSMLGSSVKILGSFTPSYWYISVNEKIASCTSFNFGSMKDIWQGIGIEVIFMVAFIAIGIAMTKRNKI